MAAILLASILVGSFVSMVPKYAVITWNCGNDCAVLIGLGIAGVCTKAAARNVCLPQASEKQERTSAVRSGLPTGRFYQCMVAARVKDPVREAVSVWAGVILGLAFFEGVGLVAPAV